MGRGAYLAKSQEEHGDAALTWIYVKRAARGASTMASWPVVSGTPGNCTCGAWTAAAGDASTERVRRSATVEMKNQAMFVATDGHASWNEPLTMKAQEPGRFAVWKP